MKKSIKAIILAGVLAIPLLAGCAKKASGSSVSEGSTNSVSGSVQPVSSFTVTYLDWDSTVLTTIKVHQGDKAVYPLDKPTRSATAQYTYTFKGWDKEEALASVTADISTTAVYNESLNQYTYKFHDYQYRSYCDLHRHRRRQWSDWLYPGSVLPFLIAGIALKRWCLISVGAFLLPISLTVFVYLIQIFAHN